MKKSLKICAVALAALVAWAVVIPRNVGKLPRPQVEPTYNGKKASTWVDALQMANGEDEGVKALTSIGPDAVPYLVDALLKRESLILESRFYAKVWSGIPFFVRGLLPRPPPKYGDNIRKAAAYALGQVGPPAKPAIPALLRCSEERNDAIRLYATQALSCIKLASDKETKVIIKRLRDPKPMARAQAARALATSSYADPRAVAPLTDLLQDTNPFVRPSAVVALWRIAPTPQRLIEVSNLLHSCEPPDYRALTTFMLGEIGAPAKPVAYVLTALQTNSNESVRTQAMAALKKIGLPTGIASSMPRPIDQ